VEFLIFIIIVQFFRNENGFAFEHLPVQTTHSPCLFARMIFVDFFVMSRKLRLELLDHLDTRPWFLTGSIFLNPIDLRPIFGRVMAHDFLDQPGVRP